MPVQSDEQDHAAIMGAEVEALVMYLFRMCLSGEERRSVKT